MDKSKQPERIFGAAKGDKFVQHAVQIILTLMVITFAFFGTAIAKESVVKPGEHANVHFTCRLKNGEIAISTYQGLSGDSSIPKSTIFLSRDRNTPLTLSAGLIPKELVNVQERGFEDEIAIQVSKAIVGLPVGEKKTLELKADHRPEVQKGEWLIKVNRVRVREKEIRFTSDEYEAKTGNKPEVGRKFVLDPALPGKVESVDDKEVVVRFFPESGNEVMTAFGKGIIRELPDRFEIVIDARPGRLVRSGGLIGRITDVHDRDITIDYGNPFGGEELLCDVMVESVSPATAQVALQGGEAAGRDSKSEKSVTALEEKQSGSTQSVQKTVKWTEDHDAGLASAKKDGKPAAMVLYADWCSWCKKLINESFQAPDVQAVEDKLVLIKVNSDKQKDIYAQYQQKGYPLLVLFDREGKVAQRINGYVDAAKLRKALDELLKG